MNLQQKIVFRRFWVDLGKILTYVLEDSDMSWFEQKYFFDFEIFSVPVEKKIEKNSIFLKWFSIRFRRFWVDLSKKYFFDFEYNFFFY